MFLIALSVLLIYNFLSTPINEMFLLSRVLCVFSICIFIGSGYGYGTVPGGRWTIDTEGGHVVVSVSLIRNGYEYGTVARRGTIHTESDHVVNSVSQMRSHPQYVGLVVNCPNFGRSGHSKGS